MQLESKWSHRFAAVPLVSHCYALHHAGDPTIRRKVLNEPFFGILKEQMAGRRFLLRGLSNVKAEFVLLATRPLSASRRLRGVGPPSHRLAQPTGCGGH